jgi:hypothetical protein
MKDADECETMRREMEVTQSQKEALERDMHLKLNEIGAEKEILESEIEQSN